MTGAPARIREAVRALVLDPAGSALLVCWEFPDRTVWGLPGGGIDEGEGIIVALRRELDEELGIGSTADIGPRIWERTHLFAFGSPRWDGQHELVYLVPSRRFAPAPRLSPEQLAAESLVGARWLTPDEMRELRRAGALLAPRRLPELVDAIVAHGPPPAPVDIGGA
ncbi:MAG: NUDIX domain-containing protein [Thermoleophilia bacterium]